MIDNYDSFTFNLVHYFQALGQQVKVVRHDQITIAEIAQIQPQYIVISPGPCSPNDSGVSLAVISAFSGKVPLLGVCLGHQCIAQHFGAVVEKAKTLMHGKTSSIEHNESELFLHIKRPMQVTRYHSLIINKATLPSCLNITAWTKTADGRIDEIMAIEHESLPIVGVQFHPESILTPQGELLLSNFLTKFRTFQAN
jgi:anthranilate synthase component 2/para-aminobenzoate synthetase component 2